MQTRIPLSMRIYLKAYCKCHGYKITDLLSEIMAHFMALRPDNRGLGWRIPYSHRTHRGATDGWAQINVWAGCDVADQVEAVAAQRGISRASIVYTAIYWFTHYLIAPTDSTVVNENFGGGASNMTESLRYARQLRFETPPLSAENYQTLVGSRSGHESDFYDPLPDRLSVFGVDWQQCETQRRMYPTFEPAAMPVHLPKTGLEGISLVPGFTLRLQQIARLYALLGESPPELAANTANAGTELVNYLLRRLGTVHMDGSVKGEPLSSGSR